MVAMRSSVNPSFDFEALSFSEIEPILSQHQIALTPDEALKIQALLQRPPRLAECILWSIQGSEHCSYKSTRPYLKTLPTMAPNVILGPKEDAGVVAVAQDHQGRRYGIVISHESHNHPSQIVPYEGAATGVGGNVRDVCCMGAEVIGFADALRFGDFKHPRTRWLDEGVVSGIAGYGNPLGIPNIAGDVYYDSAYQDNCLVTVVTLGVLREDHLIHSYVPPEGVDYDLLLVGKPTDQSGFGGASFASLELNEADLEMNKGAVQEPNAFLGRHLLKAHTEFFKYLQKENLISKVGFKDLGAGGIACASVEIADAGGFGAEVYLEKVPVSHAHLPPHVILCSETQERYLWAVPSSLTPILLKHYNETFALPEVSKDAQASVIGRVRSDGRYVVSYQGEILVDAQAHDVTSGLLYHRPHCAAPVYKEIPQLPEHRLDETLLRLLAHCNIASHKAIFERYDKQVQGRTVLERGEASAGVLAPFNEGAYPPEIQNVGVALSTAANPRYGKISAYWTAYNAVMESMRKVAAVGARPQAITDCLCFGNPEKPEIMNDIKEAIRGLKEACESVPLQDYPEAPTPVISGNVSLYNESKQTQIPSSPMMSCLGVISDVSQTLSPHFKAVGSKVIMIGERLDECGGSAYYALFNVLGSALPQPQGSLLARELYALSDLTQTQLLSACQVIREGGIAVALALMSFKNEIGFKVDIPGSLDLGRLLFSETGGFVLEVSPQHWAKVERLLKHHQVYFREIGETLDRKALQFNQALSVDLLHAKSLWMNGFREERNEA